MEYFGKTLKESVLENWVPDNLPLIQLGPNVKTLKLLIYKRKRKPDCSN